MPQTKEQRRIWYLANKDKVSAYKKQYYAKNSDKVKKHITEYRNSNLEIIKKRKSIYHAKNKTRLNIIGRVYYHAHKDRLNGLAAKRYLKNRESRIATTANWQRMNPERTLELKREVKHRRRAREYLTKIGRINYAEIKKRNGMVCGICQKEIIGSFWYDHIVPISKGGPHINTNIQLSHPRCNRMKAAKLNYIYREENL